MCISIGHFWRVVYVENHVHFWEHEHSCLCFKHALSFARTLNDPTSSACEPAFSPMLYPCAFISILPAHAWFVFGLCCISKLVWDYAWSQSSATLVPAVHHDGFFHILSKPSPNTLNLDVLQPPVVKIQWSQNHNKGYVTNTLRSGMLW
jgi:hypothetical protein